MFCIVCYVGNFNSRNEKELSFSALDVILDIYAVHS